MMQGHSGSTKAKPNQRCMLSASKPAISIKLATTVGHFLRELDLDFANVFFLFFSACPACFCSCHANHARACFLLVSVVRPDQSLTIDGCHPSRFESVFTLSVGREA